MSLRGFDVVVVGGGLSGLVLAVLLHQQSGQRNRRLAIGVVEAATAPPAPVAAEPGLRILAASRSTRILLEQCGAWAGVPAGRICPYQRMVVWHHQGEAAGRSSIMFDAAEQGVAELGYIVESDLLRGAMWQAAMTCPGIELLPGAAPVGLEPETGAMTLRLDNGASLKAQLVVGADGHDSWLRGALGITAPARPYGQQAVVAHVASEKPHRQTAWQRFLPGGPLALLPLADGRCSIVWSSGEDHARALLDAGEAGFNSALTEASAGVLGKLRLTTRRLGFPLAAQHVSRYTGLRYAFIGDAAHRVHPLAGQGANMGLLDAAVLAETLADHLQSHHADAGDPLALRRYERWRKGANMATLAGMDAFHHMFTSTVPGVARAAGAGLGLVNRLGPVKKRLADFAMGRRGDLPRVVRTARFI